MKLSDTQQLILSSASQRTDHAAVLPANLKGGAAKKVIDKLLNEKLLQELRAKDEMAVWRRGDDSRPYSLRIAHLKRILRLGRLRLRGPQGAQDEFVLAAIAQNLRRFASLVARPPPTTALCAA